MLRLYSPVAIRQNQKEHRINQETSPPLRSIMLTLSYYMLNQATRENDAITMFHETS